jgi:hypothetical protein
MSGGRLRGECSAKVLSARIATSSHQGIARCQILLTVYYERGWSVINLRLDSGVDSGLDRG